MAVAALGAISLATGAPVHVVHLASAAGLVAARSARSAGARLTLEPAPSTCSSVTPTMNAWARS